MIFTWTPDLIAEALAGLTQKQTAALDCAVASAANGGKPGPTRLKRFGFRNIDEYSGALAEARGNMQAYFAVRGIHHLADLDLPEPSRSTEGLIQASVRRLPPETRSPA